MSGYRVRRINACNSSPSDFLMHYGIKGQKWGVRRFQNEDGSLTEEGKQRYNAGYWHGQKIEETDALKARAIVGLGLKGALKYGKYVREKDKKQFEAESKKSKDEQKREFDELTRKENAEFDLGKKMENFDKLNPKQKQEVGDEVLNRISEFDAKDYRDLTHDERKTYDGLRDWMFQQIDKKSGNWNTGDSVSEEHKKVMDEMDEVSGKILDVEDSVKKKINFQAIPYNAVLESYPAFSVIQSQRREKEWKRFQEALKKDASYMDLAKEWDGKADKLCSVVLKDIGLSDTSQNRSWIYPYVIHD